MDMTHEIWMKNKSSITGFGFEWNFNEILVNFTEYEAVHGY